ncbi:MAG: protein kinase, partial [Candidatus Zixiibacteriota bacterium]
MMDDDKTRPFAALTAGAEISHYRIIRRIGAGGMGEVYLAHDKDLNRNVALKFLAPALCQDSECRQRFTHEAQAAAKLNHPNIVTVYEVSEFQGRPFFAMEFVEGQSLKDYLANDQISLEEFTRLISQICEGLNAAHEAGVVHRDIKPSNILIDAQGRARIVDFGLAMVRGIDSVTRTGSTAGTPAYMSPEQVRGERVGAVSDLFSLGVVMYQMLTGSLPFAGEYEAALIYSIANDDPAPVSKLRSDIPPGLESVVTKLLEKDTQNRYQSARDVIQALQPVTGGVSDRDRGDKSRFFLRIGILAALVIILIAVVQLSFDPFDLRTPERKMLAVLPFENYGPPEDEYFADGMTDAITLHLARFSGLGVISRASSILYKKSDKKPQEIGAELGATYLLTGTILWEKNDTLSEVRINTALVRTSDGSHVWGNSYERVLDRIFVIQSDIAQSVGRALSIAVLEGERDELARVPTENLQAYDYYLRGNEYFNRSWEQDDVQIATQMYQQAVDLDPEFALAWAMLARGH